MPEFKLQRLRGGYAIAVYDDGRRISRKQLECRDAAGAAAQFARFVTEASRPVDPNVSVVWEAYRADKVGRRIAESMGYSGRAVLPFFGAMRPSNVDVRTCRAYVALRAGQGKAPGTIRTELNQLRAAFLWAEKARLIGKAPAVEMPAKPAPRERYLTREEFTQILDASETPHLRLFLVLAISTAARVAAILDLTWDRVDFDKGMIYLGDKNVLRPRKGRATVPMTESARAALSAAYENRRTEHVIEWAGERVSGVRTSLSKAAKRAGLAGVSPHVIRHTAAVWMAEAGVPMGEIAAYLGHADALITQRVYAKFSPTHLRRAAGALEIVSVRRLT